MNLRTCEECGEYAAVSSERAGGPRLLCLDCMDRVGGEPSLDRYICSVEGCGNTPEYLVSVDEGQLRSFLVCEVHFKQLRPRLSAFMSLPRWLMNGSDISLSEEGLTIEMDFTAREEQ